MFDLAHRNGVAVLTLSRPPVNAINNDWVAGFQALLDGLEARDDWSVLHIRSDQKVFCAGADLNQIRSRFGNSGGVDAAIEDTREFQALFARIEALPRVVLAEIGGAAMGGGFELTLACDLRIAATDARLGLPEGTLGLLPAAGGTQRLTRLCGRGTASRIILACDSVDGATARELGIVQWSVPSAAIEAEARALAEHVAALPAAALAASKSCIAKAGDAGTGGFDAELEASRDLLERPETRARVIAFLDGRAKRSSETHTGGTRT